MSQAATVMTIKRMGAVMAAVGITAVFIWLLAVLNARAMVKAPTPPDLRTVLIHAADDDSLDQQQPEPEQPPEPPEPEVMTVNLDMPAPEPPLPEPLDIDLSVPTPTFMVITATMMNESNSSVAPNQPDA